MGCKANAREKRVKYRTTDYWAITIAGKFDNKLMATKKLSKEGEQRQNTRRTKQRSSWQRRLK